MTTIIKNARIYTSAEGCPQADCLVFDGKRIGFVGTAADVDMEKYGDAKIYDVGGRTVLPGIIDSHIHPGWVAKSLWHVRIAVDRRCG